MMFKEHISPVFVLSFIFVLGILLQTVRMMMMMMMMQPSNDAFANVLPLIVGCFHRIKLAVNHRNLESFTVCHPDLGVA